MPTVRQLLEVTARALAERIQPILKVTYEVTGIGPFGFCVVVFELGKSGVSTYVSNAEREGMVKALEEMLVQLKAGMVADPIDKKTGRA